MIAHEHMNLCTQSASLHDLFWSVAIQSLITTIIMLLQKVGAMKLMKKMMIMMMRGL